MNKIGPIGKEHKDVPCQHYVIFMRWGVDEKMT